MAETSYWVRGSEAAPSLLARYLALMVPYIHINMTSAAAHDNNMNTDIYATTTLMDFTETSCEAQWHAINDGVMGGQSQGGPDITEGVLHFRGAISLANNGGFASIRAKDQRHDLSGADSVLLRVRGDGRRYQIRLYTDAHYHGSRIAYATSFATLADEWLEIRLLFGELQPVVRGRQLPGPAFDPSKVEQIGFLLADKQEGPFHLAVDWIKTIECVAT